MHLTKTQLVFSWSLSSEEPPAWVQALRSGEEGFTPSRGGSSKWGITPILAAFPKFSLDIALKHHKYFYFYCLLSQFHSRANTDYITHTFIYKINSYIHKFIQDKWEAACKWAWAVITHLEHHGAGHPMALPPGTPFGSNRPTNQVREAAAQARVDPQERAGICHLRLDQFISLSRSLPRFFLNRFWRQRLSTFQVGQSHAPPVLEVVSVHNIWFKHYYFFFYSTPFLLDLSKVMGDFPCSYVLCIWRTFCSVFSGLSNSRFPDLFT